MCNLNPRFQLDIFFLSEFYIFSFSHTHKCKVFEKRTPDFYIGKEYKNITLSLSRPLYDDELNMVQKDQG